MVRTFGIGPRAPTRHFWPFGVDPSAENVNKSPRKCKKNNASGEKGRFRTFCLSIVDHIMPKKGVRVSIISHCFLTLYFATLLSPCFHLFCSPSLFRFLVPYHTHFSWVSIESPWSCTVGSLPSPTHIRTHIHNRQHATRTIHAFLQYSASLGSVNPASAKKVNGRTCAPATNRYLASVLSKSTSVDTRKAVNSA